MSKVYVLQKNLPDAKAGDEYILRGDRYRPLTAEQSNSPVIETNSYFRWQVEGNDEWFKLKEQNKEWEWTDELVAECHDYINKDTVGILTPFGVMKNIEYFKQSKSTLKKDKIEVTNLVGLKSSNCVEVYFNKNVDSFKEKYPIIKKAIENELNK